MVDKTLKPTYQALKRGYPAHCAGLKAPSNKADYAKWIRTVLTRKLTAERPVPVPMEVEDGGAAPPLPPSPPPTAKQLVAEYGRFCAEEAKDAAGGLSAIDTPLPKDPWTPGLAAPAPKEKECLEKFFEMCLNTPTVIQSNMELLWAGGSVYPKGTA